MSGAARALTRLRDEKVIQGWGLGVNRVEPCELALERADPDGFLLAGRYTLLDHAGALERLMPESAARGAGIIVGGPYNSGVLAGGTHYEYQPATQAMLDRVARIRRICERFGVDVRAVALQFARAPGRRGRDPRREPARSHRRQPASRGDVDPGRTGMC